MSFAAEPDSTAGGMTGGTGVSPVPAAARRDARPTEPGRRYLLLVLAAVCLASFALYVKWVVRPFLLMDDFQILVRSWTWQRTWDELWVPANEHAMPLGRLTTWALVQLAGRVSAVPQLAALQGPLVLVMGALLVYLFVRRELGHPAYGLTAAALFAVSTLYAQAVYWFSSSFSILTLDTLLLALLAAQAWRHTGRVVYLILCVLGVALAPTWFATGVLAGPLCALYLLLPERTSAGERSRLPALLRSCLIALVPLLGTALFLAISLPRTADAIMHLPHYDGKTAVEVVKPLPGLKYTAWSVVENLLLGAVGVGGVHVPFPVACAVWPPLIAAGVWWWRGAPAGRRLMLLGLGLILSGYLLVYSARADWMHDGEALNSPVWSRYHLQPQLGLALFVAGGLPRWAGRCGLRAGSGLTPRQAGVLLGVVALLCATQLPRAALTIWGEGESGAQIAALREVDEMDARCRRHRIGAATARAALDAARGPLDVPGCYEREDCWQFLRGSPDPDPSITSEEARRLLTGDGE